MSATTKRELESPSQDSASKRRRQHHDENIPASQSRIDEDHADSSTTDHNGEDGREQYNPKNLLKAGALSHGSLGTGTTDAYQRKRITMTLLLAPCDVHDPLAGVARQLDDVLWTYVTMSRGILMGWRNIKFETTCGPVLEESPFTAVQVSLDTLVWRPRRDEVVEGRVTFMGPSHIGLLILGTFNASVPVHLIPTSWSFVESYDGQVDGHWINHQGKKLSLDQVLPFRTVSVKKGANILSVEGSLLDQADLPAAVSSDPAQDDAATNKDTKSEAPEIQVKTENTADAAAASKRQRKAEKERRKSEKRAHKEKRKSKGTTDS